VGQRRGLGLMGPEPLYVVGIEADADTLRVGPAAALARDRLRARDVSWVSPEPPREPFEAAVRIRYRHPEARARVVPLADGRIDVLFAEPQRAVAPGQAAVLYDGEVCLGGGWIESAA
jgi:tRNA-specific 2-thiouridylase